MLIIIYSRVGATVSYLGVKVHDALRMWRNGQRFNGSAGGVEFRRQLYEWTLRLIARGSGVNSGVID